MWLPSLRAAALSAAGWLALTASEGKRKTVYLDIAGIPTVCMGTTEGLTRSHVGKRLSKEECSLRDGRAVKAAEDAIKSTVRVPLTQDQFDSLVSFVYNIGEPRWRTSTALRVLNLGDYKGTAREIRRWDKVTIGGKAQRVKRQTARREEEAAAFEVHTQ